jgi:hypothetical protein
VLDIFLDKVSGTICPGWLCTMILLISASWVARITGMSHWYLTVPYFWDRVLLYAQASLDCYPPICASPNSRIHRRMLLHTSSHLLRWGFADFLPSLALNLNPLDLCFLSS